MEKQKHTPGPWRTGDRFTTIFGPSNGNPVPLVIAGLAVSHPTNARLISAAPELLDVCKFAYAELDERYDVDQPAGGTPKEYPFTGAGELMKKLRAAIAKAEGRT